MRNHRVEITENNLICLNQIVSMFIRSTKPSLYMERINKKKIGGKYYITAEICLAIITKGKDSACKKLMSQINEKNNTGRELLNTFNIDKGTLRLGGIPITCILDVDYETIWMKAVEVTKLLEYSNSRDAIKNHVESDNKLTYGEFVKRLKNDSKCYVPSKGKKMFGIKGVDSHTNFINIKGLYSLIFESKMKKAKEFKSWIANFVLPSLQKHGIYTINTKHLDFKDVPMSVVIKDFRKKNVIYIGYIGYHNNEHIFKFGITKDMYKRQNEHIATYDQFNLAYLRESNSNGDVETELARLIKGDKLHRNMICYEQNRTELFAVSDEYPLEYVMCLADHIIDTYDDKKISGSDKKISESRTENKLLVLRLEVMETKFENIVSKLEIVKLKASAQNNRHEKKF